MKCAHKAYDESLRKYHGWIVRGIFSVREMEGRQCGEGKEEWGEGERGGDRGTKREGKMRGYRRNERERKERERENEKCFLPFSLTLGGSTCCAIPQGLCGSPQERSQCHKRAALRRHESCTGASQGQHQRDQQVLHYQGPTFRRHCLTPSYMTVQSCELRLNS